MMPRSIDSDDRLTASARSVLMALSSRANENGECWPSLTTLAHDARVSKRTAMRSIEQLVECGYISKGRRFSSGKGRAPSVYRILFDRQGRKTVAPGDSTDDKGEHLSPPSCQIAPNHREHLSPPSCQIAPGSIEREVDKGSKDKEVEPPISPKGGDTTKPTRVKRYEYSDEFETFWNVYPRKDSKRRALTAFNSALKRATLDEICAGAARYANDPNREPQYTKHAATWLNGDCWLDDPLPARRVSDPWGDRVRSVLAAGQTQPPPPNVGYGYPPRLISGGDYDDL
ncbi:helix-turn-helix domain-containing protein [Gleimia europaea]|uniref:helix-turn-helix domain-containing protein n=1 Tax=Gleimia europaea TaxID=66228 RepID=UPI000C800586